VQAHIFGELGILGTALSRVYSGKRLPIFIKIGSYFTDKEQKINWHSFLRHDVLLPLLLSIQYITQLITSSVRICVVSHLQRRTAALYKQINKLQIQYRTLCEIRVKFIKGDKCDIKSKRYYI